MKTAFIFLCLACFAAAAGGATVEVSTEGWAGSGVIESTVLTNMTVFAADIRVKCSSATPERLLQVVFLRGNAVVCTNVIRDVFRADRPETQHIEVDRALRANAVRLSLSGKGSDTWDILSVALSCAAVEPRPEKKPGFRITVS